MATVMVIFLSFCNFCAVGPWYSFQKRTFTRQNTFKFYRIGMLLFLVLSFIIMAYFMALVPFPILLKYTIFLERFGEISLACTLVYYSRTKLTHWKCLLAEKRYLDISVTYLDNSERCWVFWIFYSFTFVIIVYEFGKASITKEIYILLLLMPRLIFNHGYMISAMVSSNLAINLKSASARLKEMVTTKELSDNERKFTDDLKEMRILYNAILKKMHSFNEIFGNFLFAAMCHLLVSNSGLFGFLFHKFHYDEPDVITLILPVTIFFNNMLGLFYAVTCCDETMREGKRLLWTCFIRKGNIIRGHCRDELAQFTEYVKDYPVVLTAADFFDLTRNNLLGHMGIVGTYSMVFAQFSSVKR